MEMKIKEKFIALWKKYFNGAELPITFYYTDQPEGIEEPKPASEHRCVIGDLSKVRSGKSLRLGADFNRLRRGKEVFRFCSGNYAEFRIFSLLRNSRQT